MRPSTLLLLLASPTTLLAAPSAVDGTYPIVLDPGKYPAYTAGRDYSFRTMLSIRMLHEHDKISFEDMVELKHSTHLELADRVVSDLLKAGRHGRRGVGSGFARGPTTSGFMKAFRRGRRHRS